MPAPTDYICMDPNNELNFYIHLTDNDIGSVWPGESYLDSTSIELQLTIRATNGKYPTDPEGIPSDMIINIYPDCEIADVL